MTQGTNDNIFLHEGGPTRQQRWRELGCGGCTLWFTGLSGSGKSTIAHAVESALIASKIHAYCLDGDNVRLGLNKGLTFSAADRAENIRRVGEVAKLFADSGCIAIASLISPYATDRAACRAVHAGAGLKFIEIFVDTPLAICEQRDPKGLYKKARAGLITGFTGIDDPYERPHNPELILTPATHSIDHCVGQCLSLLSGLGVIAAPTSIR